MKKIAIFVDSEKRSGGAYQELLYTIKNIKKYNDDDVKFLIICVSKKLKIELEKEHFDLYYFSLNAVQRYICYLRNFGSLSRRIKKYFFFKNKFEKFLKEKNVDLVYFTGPSQYSLYLEDIKFFINVPDVSHRENLEFPEIVNSSEFQRKDEIFSKSLPRAIAIITNSEIIKKRISFFYSALPEKIYIINHQPSSSISNFKNIDLEKKKKFEVSFKLPKNYIFYPSMYLPHKNHKNLIDALKILKVKFKTDLNIVFCGNDIGYLSGLKKYVNKENLTDLVYFLDFVQDEYLPYLYLDSSLLVMPSLIGPTNIPPWEAFKMKVPVIYSELEGIKEVFEDSVYYINPLKPESIANGINEVLMNHELRNNLINKGSEKLKEIEKKNEFKNFFEIIRKYKKIKETWEFND